MSCGKLTGPLVAKNRLNRRVDGMVVRGKARTMTSHFSIKSQSAGVHLGRAGAIGGHALISGLARSSQ